MMWNIWKAEWRVTARQRSYYSILILWVAVLSLLMILQRTNNEVSGYTNITGTIVNIMLYIIPLFMLIFGSFSIANEKENGQWRLLRTYPIETGDYLIGKLCGQFTAQVIVFSLAYWISMVIGLISGTTISLKWMLILFLFSIALIFFFITIGVLIGSFVKTRWQALTGAVSAWFFLIMIWPTALIALLGLLPYPFIGFFMKVAVFINPAEFLRFLLVVQLDGAAIFGQSYDMLIPMFKSGVAWGSLIVYGLVFFIISAGTSIWILNRRGN